MKRAYTFFKTTTLALLLLSLQSCAGNLHYSAAPIEAWVVDAESGQPIEGVIVVAHWQLEKVYHFIPHQVNPAGQLMVMEAVTDEQGRFYFPAWGPKWHLGAGELLDKDPELIFFKNGYQFWGASNFIYSRPGKYHSAVKPTGADRISFWNGETIKLEKFKGSLEEYAHNVYDLNRSIDNIYNFPPASREKCFWKQIPRMIVEIHNMSVYFDSKGVKLKGWRGGQRIDKLNDISTAPNCGAVVDFVKGYFK